MKKIALAILASVVIALGVLGVTTSSSSAATAHHGAKHGHCHRHHQHCHQSHYGVLTEHIVEYAYFEGQWIKL